MTAGSLSTFVSGQWFNKDTTSRYLSSYNTVATYNVRVFTTPDSDMFDGEAFITFYGSWGGSGEVLLANDSDKYAPGSCESFQVETGSVNVMSCIQLRVVSACRMQARECYSLLWLVLSVLQSCVCIPDLSRHYLHFLAWSSL